MLTDYKYQSIIRDDVAQTTSVVFSIYEGEYVKETIQDIEIKSGKQITKTIDVYRRTTPISQPLETHSVTFSGILSETELSENINKVFKEIIEKSILSKTVIDEQKALPLVEKEIVKIEKTIWQ